MYQQQMANEFNGEMGQITTTSPLYYSNGNGQRSKPSPMQSYGYSNGKDSNGQRSKLNSRYEATSYGGGGGGSSSSSVTPSPIGQESYETTPYNLDAALGEEIHSETPLIESLPLTTILPHVEKVVDMAIASRKTAAAAAKTKSSSLSPYYGFGTKK
ncbi:hypothetical protein BLA29_010666 [Euroglyphus maynei]|uniref:Uncharacterized protein n=1 Tax=Euroglyphus maynei TaxID=6958 RepID=A0A1Y3BM93_EURMA|nr:hypothetical protein BLA29_010666 [Euroglyphus maynei]